MNQVTLLGRLTRDPELKHLNGNNAVCNVGLAVSKKYRNAAGELKEETTFVDCEAWSKTAENIQKYFNKGSRILISGELRLEEWQDKDGGKRSKLKVRINTFDFIDKSEQKPSQAPVANGYAKPIASVSGDVIDKDFDPFN